MARGDSVGVVDGRCLAAGPAHKLPRIMGAIAAAIALHAAILVFRPGVSGDRATAASASAMVVRIVHAGAGVAAPRSNAEPAPAAAAAPALERSEPVAAPAKAQVGADAAKADARSETSEARPASRAMPAAEPVVPSPRELAPAPEYALGIRLDPGPRPLDDIDPEYPDPVNLRTGSVVLRLLISETGHVDDVSVVRADPPGVFDQAAVEAFSKARFSPGVAGGTPVKSQIRVEVQFMPINRGARVSGRSY